MNLYDRLPGTLLGTTMISALMVVHSQPAFALTGEEINEIARNVTVLITDEEGGHGSGAIISKQDDTYYVLTAYHVVSNEGEYAIIAPDKKAYKLDDQSVQRLPNVDLAVVAFESEENFQTVKLANVDTISPGSTVFVSGWPAPGAVGEATGGQVVRQFTTGNVSGHLDQPIEGYSMIYTNVTRRGMSGGPVLDTGGRLVGIHGLGDYESPDNLQQEGLTPEAARSIASLIKPGFNYAIPANTFLKLAPQQGLYLSLEVENTPAPPLGAPYTADNSEPDPRDTIDDINATLDTINRIRNTIRNFF